MTQDQILVRAALRGSSAAFEVLIRRYHVQVTQIAYRLTNNADTAKDVAQEAFIHAYTRLEQLRPNQPFSRWLFAIARNAAIDSMRRGKRIAKCHVDENIISTEPGPEDVALRADEEVRLHAALQALPQRYRDSLRLYYIGGLRYREIAKVLGLPLGTVKTNVSRGKARLRKDFKAMVVAA